MSEYAIESQADVSQVETSPVRVERVYKARPGTGHQFEFEDDGTPAARKPQPPTKGGVSNKGQGLYKDHVIGNDDDEGTAHGDGRALDDATKAVKSKNRSQDFGAHWEMNDNTPVSKSNENQKPSHQATKSNFGFYDESPQQSYKINIAGNGMGNRAGTQFSLFDDEPEEPKADDRSIGNHKGIKATGDGMGGRKGAEKSFWDF